jgi:inner membrane protein
MASIGHIAVGMAAARVSERRVAPWSSMASWAGLSMLPDVDVIGFPLGVHYGDPWGHRGATHSLLFAVAIGLVVGIVARRRGRAALRTGLVATAVVASHGLLDTMTDGGLGSALFWPFDLTRYFAPWRPLPVAPIGPGIMSAYGVSVMLTEVVLFSPLMLVALKVSGRKKKIGVS